MLLTCCTTTRTTHEFKTDRSNSWSVRFSWKGNASKLVVDVHPRDELASVEVTTTRQQTAICHWSSGTAVVE